MTLLVALAAYALGAKQSEVTLLGARGAYDRHTGLVILLVAPWLKVFAIVVVALGMGVSIR